MKFLILGIVTINVIMYMNLLKGAKRADIKMKELYYRENLNFK